MLTTHDKFKSNISDIEYVIPDNYYYFNDNNRICCGTYIAYIVYSILNNSILYIIVSNNVKWWFQMNWLAYFMNHATQFHSAFMLTLTHTHTEHYYIIIGIWLDSIFLLLLRLPLISHSANLL